MSHIMMDASADFADRLRETIERRTRLRGAFRSPLLIEENEQQLANAQRLLHMLEVSGVVGD